MSGHSKWATIHRQKEAKDAKRGAAFTKLANAITIAVREGGGVGDPETNFKLRLAVEKARSINMPKDNIQRAIDRGTGAGGAVVFEQAMYEGFGPGGAAVLVEVATDNKQRTVSEVKNIFDKSGGSMGGAGSVSYLFKKRGLLIVGYDGTIDDAMMKLIDTGVEDIEEVEDGLEVYSEPQKLYEVKALIEALGLAVKSAELVMDPTTSIDITSETAEKLQNLLVKLEELDDVQKVYTNANFIA